ncbi:hypothetical protein I7I50_04580 [Histoplasma capsulatum G186AR]|uniref:Uncharacterized protein n=1 Tax=Ajellomyces capsulatus TaxID=5037 RepID=A0A8H7YPS3_AJECA|nr:hypothetical protein I7I52_05489 [Histoplasma capsulatum]QSS75445.1 hypothetical protein I7I50_04580 [Histoplasma capsulatum G186AR]
MVLFDLTTDCQPWHNLTNIRISTDELVNSIEELANIKIYETNVPRSCPWKPQLDTTTPLPCFCFSFTSLLTSCSLNLKRNTLLEGALVAE